MSNCVCQEKELILSGVCARRCCPNKWSKTLTDPSSIKFECKVHSLKICGGESSVCQSCADQGYNCVCQQKELIVTGDCARRECSDKWSKTLTDPSSIKFECKVHTFKICGEGSSVCQSCADQGYSACSGIGDGKTYISKDGKHVDIFPSF